MYKDVDLELINHSNPTISNLARRLNAVQHEVIGLSKFREDAKRYRWIRDTNLQDFRDTLGSGLRYEGAVEAVTVSDGRFAAILNPRDFNRVIDNARAKFYPEKDERTIASDAGRNKGD